LALCVLHYYLENYQSLNPFSIEETFHDYLKSILSISDDPEVKLMTRYIARYTFKNAIENKVEDLDSQNKSCKIILDPLPSLLLGEDGLSIRNNTFLPQKYSFPNYIIMALKDSDVKRWYWEITVASSRYIKVGYSFTNEQVLGVELTINRSNETFGLIFDKKEKKFTVLNEDGIQNELETDEVSFSPCIEIAALQQVTFNFNKAILTKPEKVQLFSVLQTASRPSDYTCDLTTFRQAETYPFMNPYLSQSNSKKREKDS